MVRYYGLYANAHRGKKRKAGVDLSCPPISEDEICFVPSRGWADMIKKVYEINPLIVKGKDFYIPCGKDKCISRGNG